METNNSDRRIFDRVQARFPAKFRGPFHGFGSEVFLRDISGLGAKVTTRKNVYVNDTIDMLVELPDGKDPLPLSGKVVWVRAQNPQLRDVGLAFEKIDLMETQRIFKFCL